MDRSTLFDVTVSYLSVRNDPVELIAESEYRARSFSSPVVPKALGV